MRSNSALFLITLLLLGVAGNAAGDLRIPAPPGQSSEPAPGQITPDQVQMIQKLGKDIPGNSSFTDQNGRPVQLSSYLGSKPIILVFAYYKCSNLCTLVLNGLVEALKAVPLSLGKDYDVLTVSINPKEKPELALMKRRTYLAALGVTEAPGWHFLTGEETQIKAATGAAGFQYVYDPGSREYAHPSGLIVLTPQGRISRYFAGVAYEPRDLRLALVEASHRKIGSPIDRIFLACFHYDPSTGRYSPRILTFVRIFGVITVVAIGLGYLALRRKERTA